MSPRGTGARGISQTDGSRFLFLVAPAKELVKKFAGVGSTRC